MTNKIKTNYFTNEVFVEKTFHGKETDSLPSEKTARVSVASKVLKIPGRPPGIPNQGNSCFGASVVQVIANVGPLALGLPRLASEKSGAYLSKILPLYQKEKQEGDQISRLPIQEIREAFPHSRGNMGQYAQQDAHELLLGILGSVCINLDPQIPLKNQLEIYKGLLESPLVCLKTVRKTVAISKEIPLGQTRLTRVPGNPDTAISETHSIEIPILNVNLLADRKTRQVHPLPALLEHNYFSRFLLEKETYRSQNVEGPILKDEIYFNRLPEVLIVNLVRQGIKVSVKDGKRDFAALKFNHEVPMPATLAAPPNATLRHEKGEYELRAYIVQMGAVGGGHYIALVKTTDSKGDRYWFCNDGQVDYVPQEMFEAQARHAYVALYVKKPSLKKGEALELKELSSF